MKQGPCPHPHCGSSDAFTEYDDGHTHCFSCGAHSGTAGNLKTIEAPKDLIEFEATELPVRCISKATCEKFSYGIGEYGGEQVQVATYFKDGAPVAQKVRDRKKNFHVLGNAKKMGLFGDHLWRPGSARIVVTEGEIDCLSVSTVQDDRWPVVSIPNGAAGAVNAVKKNLEYLSSFGAVVLCFDMDEPGQQAAQACAALLPPGRAHIASLPLKDASEMLQAGRAKELIQALWDAKTWRPDGIISGREVLARIHSRPSTPAVEMPWGFLQERIGGHRIGEVLTVCAGSGIGKTEFTRELAFNLLNRGHQVGYLALEESPERCAVGLIGMALNQRIHLLDNPEAVPGYAEAADKIITDRCHFYDHFGSNDPDNLIAKIRYMVKSLDCHYVVLDHVSIVVSGLEDGDERRIIDNLMTRLKSLTQEVPLHLLMVSHLKDPGGGRSHEEGASTSLNQLRGSRSIGQLSNVVIGLERDQQDTENSNRVAVRVLKERNKGQTGIAGYLNYDTTTGRFRDEITQGF